ncbi:TVP38/TMEM64 family protein [Paenibacillus athensensis]|uniref:TVP38/TMEM64 family membrane protein n=1 Tax=Paenibacillus athensensis TaxID=1967502 RepID=A0A4Y8PSI4_9BACL|nr:TVP38/TMEM64 family protein [Paenibacillus athensensis]MCD1260563.1 TVP38/TMEM64 family protein [Paenibacillus athensensis]
MKLSKSVKLLILWFALALCGLLLWKFTNIGKSIHMDAISVWLRELGFVGGLLYILAYTLRPLVLFPAIPLTVFGGYTFGAFWGTVYDVIGAGAGAVLSFQIARRWGRGSFERLIRGKKLQTFDEKAEKNGFMVVLYMRLLPFFPFDGVSYGAGLSKIRTGDYTWATFIGIIPGAVVYNVLGDSLQEIGSMKFYLAVALYVAFALIPLVVRRRQKARAEV